MNHVVIIWWRGRIAPSVSGLMDEASALDLATRANNSPLVADSRASTWADACALLEAEERERAS